MRILFALHGYLPDGRGGTEVHVHTLAKRLKDRHQVRVVCREGDPKKPDFAVTRGVFEGIEVTRINNLHEWIPDFEWTYKSGRVHELFEKELVAFKPDIVHIHHLTGLSTTIVETIKAGGLPLVMTLHDFWTVCPRGQRMTKELDICEHVDRNICFHCLGGLWPDVFADRGAQRTELDSRGHLAPKPLADFDRHMAYILNLADLLIAPSWFHRERMLDFPLDPERIVALPHGLDHAPYARISRKPRPVRKIGFIGSVIPIKGPHVLVDAFRQLGRADLELHIHGEAFPFHDDRNYLERLKSRALGLRNVHFHGAYLPSDLPRILSELDVLVVPSLWWESFCLTIREGQLAGVPVIASDLGAMREALDGEERGLLFRPGDAGDLATKIEKVIEDEALRERLSHCRGAVKTMEEYVPELLALYERAQGISTRRAGTIVVAPPSFPEAPPQVNVTWALPDPASIVVGPPNAVSPHELSFSLLDKATGQRLATFNVGIESNKPLTLQAKDGAASQPRKEARRPAQEPPAVPAAPAGEPSRPHGAGAHRAKARRSRRHRRERRKRPM